MKLRIVILNILTVILFSGCASMFVPDQEQIDKLQIVKMGSIKPEGNEYILHIPAGTEIPVRFTLNGSLISAPIDNKQVTRLNHDLFVYKYWSSLDGKNWKPTGEIVSMPITIGVDPEGGQLDVKVDLLKN